MTKKVLMKKCFVKTAALFGFLALSFVTALWLSFGSVKAQSGNVEDVLFRRVVSADDQGRLEDAKEDIKRVLKLNPRHVGAQFYAGKVWYNMGENAKAQNIFERIKNDKEYGARANSLLADMRLREQQGKNLKSVKVLVTGEVYEGALKLCEDFLRKTPNESEFLYYASLLACVMNNRDKAESYAVRFRQLLPKDLRGMDLNSLLAGWFMEDGDDENWANKAVDKLLEIEDRELLIWPVKNRIKELLSYTRESSKFERFIMREAEVPGADVGSLEKELIAFLIENEEYLKALDVLERRPVDSLDDNLLYVKILLKTGKEEKAIENAGYLINANPDELRCYKAWVDAWIAFVDRKQEKPGGSDGKEYLDRAESILKKLNPEKFVTSDEVLLIKLFRMAVLTENLLYAEELKSYVLKVRFTNDLADMLIYISDELVAFYKRDMAMELLQEAWNQLPNNNAIPFKMAELTMDTEPAAAVKIAELILEDNPEHTSALLIWAESMSRLGKAQEAVDKLVARLEDPTLDPIVERQLQAKVDLFTYQGADYFSVETDDPFDNYYQDSYEDLYGDSTPSSQNIEDYNSYYGVDQDDNVFDDTPSDEERLPRPRREFLAPIEKK